jgi:hypothetical protein
MTGADSVVEVEDAGASKTSLVSLSVSNTGVSLDAVVGEDGVSVVLVLLVSLIERVSTTPSVIDSSTLDSDAVILELVVDVVVDVDSSSSVWVSTSLFEKEVELVVSVEVKAVGVTGTTVNSPSLLGMRGREVSGGLAVAARVSCLSTDLGLKKTIGPAEQKDKKRKNRKSIAKAVWKECGKPTTDWAMDIIAVALKSCLKRIRKDASCS